MKAAKASERANRRYLLIEGSRQEAEKAILDFIGILGWAEAAPIFVSEKPLILAMNREKAEKVRGAFALAKIRVSRVSGTLKGLKKI